MVLGWVRQVRRSFLKFVAQTIEMKGEGCHEEEKRFRPGPDSEIEECIEAICDSFRCLNQGKRRDGRSLGLNEASTRQRGRQGDSDLGPVWGEKQDVYALGVVMKGLLGNPASNGGKHLPGEWDRLAEQCLASDPSDRPGFDELIDAMHRGRETTPARRKRRLYLIRIVPILAGTALIVFSALALNDLLPGWSDRFIRTEQAAVVIESSGIPETDIGQTGLISLSSPAPSRQDSSPTGTNFQASSMPLIGQGVRQSIEFASLLYSVVDAPSKKEIRLPDFGTEDDLNYASLFHPDAELERPNTDGADRVYWQTPEKTAEAAERSFLLDSIGIEMIWIDDVSGWVARSEVTHDQFVAIFGDSPSRYQSPGRACDSVSWDQAMAFCRILTDMERKKGNLPEGYAYTLPTEEQWKVYVGDANREHSIYGRSRSHGPMAPGTRKANFWGLVDVRGNLWEWMLDDHTPGNPSRGKALRGGAFVTSGKMLMDRNARFYGARDINYFQYGFRPVLVMEER